MSSQSRNKNDPGEKRQLTKHASLRQEHVKDGVEETVNGTPLSELLVCGISLSPPRPPPGPS